MSNHQFPSYVLLTDAPPLKEGGYGCHVVASNWLEMAGPNAKLVVTRRLDPALTTEQIARDVKPPLVFYPDLSRLQSPRRFQPIRSLLEVGIFLLALPRLAAQIRDSGADRIFALFGGNPWFLIVADWVARRTGLPLDIYLVDDLEESARLAGQPWVARLVRRMEPKVLGRAQRVFTISPGYAEHLRSKYNVAAQWLPIPFPPSAIAYQPFVRQKPDVRTIAFIGAVNPLYLGALKGVLMTIEEWNRANNEFQLRLLIMSYTSPAYIKQELGPSEHLEVCFRANTEELQRRLRDCWIILVPYSFDEEVRLMITTSFASKLVSSFLVGRPILVYGPPHASVPRYFADNHLPLCAHSPSQLKTALQEVAQYDTEALIKDYEKVVQRLHSPAHLRTLLAAIEQDRRTAP